ncbi:hypothetical protein VFPPC_17651 [Pochonia chlamydosporia 170]|uniref:Uncharacterized protein n=1 Tax=Pochonia chlamydosporia 170 TaxID=1380566 RepID=A0A219AQV8_METCM|nr:hypothetical protein VFPPC_17651 [Pochonia chlamydosporia 170]OWT43173.1 hypothetical protein VFPPC_17651 [Pochonia chlamydosporia 170]
MHGILRTWLWTANTTHQRACILPSRLQQLVAHWECTLVTHHFVHQHLCTLELCVRSRDMQHVPRTKKELASLALVLVEGQRGIRVDLRKEQAQVMEAERLSGRAV